MALTVNGQLDDWLRYSLIGFTAARGLQLLRHFGSPGALLNANDATLAARDFLTPANIEKIRASARTSPQHARLIVEQFAITPIAIDDAGYPARLRTISDPPPILYVRGAYLDADSTAVAIVGTRRASTYGRLVAERLGSDLARHGVTVISGLARGIDTAAHQGALRAGGRTIAVCGCGIDVPYPSENKELLEQIVIARPGERGSGCALSEFPLGTNPEPWHFPARNRVISGLALGVIVVEAPENSGALITADYAAEHGRDVMAVPGNIDSGKSKGCHRLLKEGARLVESVDDVLEELNIVAQPRLFDAPRAPRPQLSPLENRLMGKLSLVPRHIDELTREAELTAAQASATLLTLEIKGHARKLPGSMFVRTS